MNEKSLTQTLKGLQHSIQELEIMVQDLKAEYSHNQKLSQTLMEIKQTVNDEQEHKYQNLGKHTDYHRGQLTIKWRLY